VDKKVIYARVMIPEFAEVEKELAQVEDSLNKLTTRMLNIGTMLRNLQIQIVAPDDGTPGATGQALKETSISASSGIMETEKPEDADREM